jgi:hypothetical protein
MAEPSGLCATTTNLGGVQIDMAGKLIPILPKRTFTFKGTTPSTRQIVLVERIDVSQYIDCMVAARAHESFLDGSAFIDVYGEGYTDEDPSLQFRTSAPLFSAGSLTLYPFLIPYGGTVHGQYITLVLNVNKGTNVSSALTVSVDLILRSPNDIEV